MEKEEKSSGRGDKPPRKRRFVKRDRKTRLKERLQPKVVVANWSTSFKEFCRVNGIKLK